MRLTWLTLRPLVTPLSPTTSLVSGTVLLPRVIGPLRVNRTLTTLGALGAPLTGPAWLQVLLGVSVYGLLRTLYLPVWFYRPLLTEQGSLTATGIGTLPPPVQLTLLLCD